MRKNYQKPKVKASKIKINFFLSQNRFLDSFDSLASPKILDGAEIAMECCSCGCSGCGGCGGCGGGGGNWDS